MATILRVPPKPLRNSVFPRLLTSSLQAQKSVGFASLRDPLPEHGPVPVPYSSSKAAKISIAEVVGLKSAPEAKKPSWLAYVFPIVVITGVFYIYFFSHENETDNLIPPLNLSEEDLKLLDLKLKLIYCTTNNLPVGALKAKIQELEERKGTRVSHFKV